MSIDQMAWECGLKAVLATVATGVVVLPCVSEPMETALRELGAQVVRSQSGLQITGMGNGCLLQPNSQIDFADDGMAALIFAGLVASYDMPTTIKCDAWPAGLGAAVCVWREMGIQIKQDDKILQLHAPAFCAPVSAQLDVFDTGVAAALLLSALNVAGRSTFAFQIGDLKDLETLKVLFEDFGADLTLHAEAPIALSIVGQVPLTAQEGCSA